MIHHRIDAVIRALPWLKKSMAVDLISCRGKLRFEWEAVEAGCRATFHPGSQLITVGHRNEKKKKTNLYVKTMPWKSL